MRSLPIVLLALSFFVSLPLAFAADTTASLNADATVGEKKEPDSDAKVEAEVKTPVVDDASSKLSKEELTQLELLENHFFGRLHPSELLDRRVERLERFVFGIQGSGAEYGARLDKLSATLSTVDPDGKKRVISIEPTAAASPASASAPASPSQNPAQVPESVQNATLSMSSAVPVRSSRPVVQIPSQIQSINDSSGLPSALTDSKDDATTNADNRKSSAVPDDIKVNEDFYKNAPAVASARQPNLAGQVQTELHQGEVAGVLHCNKNLFPVDGAPNEVIRELSVAIKVRPSDPELMFERAKAEMLLNRIDNALSDLSDAIMNSPNRSLYYLARAWCYKQSGNSVLANDDLKQAKFVDPGLPAKIDFLQ